MMARLLQIFKRESLPEGIAVKLVSLLFTNYVPVIAMGTILTTASLYIAWAFDDLVACAIGILSIIGSILRLRLLLAFRKRAQAGGLDDAEALEWERRFALRSIYMGALVGTLCFHAVGHPDPYLTMLAMAILFGYASGLVSRTSMRPAICFRGLFVAVLPTLAGLIWFAPTQPDPVGPAIYFGLAAVILAFTLASLESVLHVYRTIVRDLLTQRDLAALAGQDILTGLPNRLVLRSRFSENMGRVDRNGPLLALHCVDLDLFKAVNDQYGHRAGDDLLQAVASRISGTLQAADTVARVGGDEFVIIQTGVRDTGAAEALAKRVIRVLSEPFSLNGIQVRIGATIGIGLAPRDGIELAELSAHGDEALYQAKAAGRGSYCVFGSPPVSVTPKLAA